MWYLTKALFLLTFSCLGYATFSALCAVLRRKPGPGATLGRVDSDSLPVELPMDSPTRLLLRFGEESEMSDLARRFDEDDTFRASVLKRQRQLIQLYCSGSMPPDLAESFRHCLLSVSGIPQEVEVERALRSILDSGRPKLRVDLTDQPSKSQRFWRRLTLPGLKFDAELAEGPRLMVHSAYLFGEPVHLLGSVVSVDDDHIEVDLGLNHGIGPGDFIQIERDADKWVGSGVIESSTEVRSKGLFMGDDKAREGDRVLARFSEE